MYSVRFPDFARERDFGKAISKIPPAIQNKIMDAVQALSDNPRFYGATKIIPAIGISNYLAQYRIRVGNFRVLYDIDDKNKIVWIFDLRKRSEATYK